MTYLDFYDIAEYGNEHWKGGFSNREVADNAYDYKSEYDYSHEQGEPMHTMIELCRLIIEDKMWWNKYNFANFNLEMMDDILMDFINGESRENSFIDDQEKMIDFFVLDKKIFLSFYSYLSEEDYDQTKRDVLKRSKYWNEDWCDNNPDSDGRVLKDICLGIMLTEWLGGRQNE